MDHPKDDGHFGLDLRLSGELFHLCMSISITMIKLWFLDKQTNLQTTTQCWWKFDCHSNPPSSVLPTLTGLCGKLGTNHQAQAIVHGFALPVLLFFPFFEVSRIICFFWVVETREIGKLPLVEFTHPLLRQLALGGMFIHIGEYTEAKKPTYQLVAPSTAFPGQQVGWICCNKLMWSWCGRLWLVAFHVDGYIRIWWPQIPQINTCPNGFTKIDWKDRCFACLQTVLPFCGLELLQLLTTAYNRDGTCKFRVLTKHKVSGVKYVPKNCCKNNQSFSRVIYNSIARKSYTKQQILTT